MGKRALCAVAASLALFLGLVAMACVGDDPVPSTASESDSGGGADASDGGTGSSEASPDGPDASEASAPLDAAGGDYSIHCESQLCQASDVCCVEADGGDYAGAACKAKAACASTYLECDSTHECPAGLVCCANTNGGSFFWASSSCTASCTGSQRQLCDSTSECDGGCESNAPSIGPPNLHACAL